MQIEISDEAKDDIAEIYRYIAKNSLRYASETVNNIYDSIDYLELSPYLGRYVHEFEDKKYREIFYKNYRIVYTIQEKEEIIYIHFVIHGKRNLITFFNKYITENNL